jgi:hypothetical protein
MEPFGMVEVGGAVFGQLMDELVRETHSLKTSISRDSMVVSVIMPDGTVVYLNPRLHPGDVMISNVAGHS